MKQSIFTVVSNEALTDSVYKMVLSGDTSAITAPGQFVNIKLDGMFLRRPISVCDYNDQTLTIVYKVVGKGTEVMSKMQGGKLDILTGLGNGYDLTKAGDIIRGRTFSAFMPLIAVALIYLALVIVLTALVRRLERRLNKSER